MHAGLSTGAELLLLAIDPDDGELLPRRRLRFLRALALAEGARPRRGAALRGFAARRRALRELRDAGVVEEEGRRPVDRLAGGKRFRRIREGLVADSLDERDDTLLVLLAYSGLLVPRLSRDERRLAHRRLRGLVAHPGAAPRSGGPPAAETAAALGGAIGVLQASYLLGRIDFGGDAPDADPGHAVGYDPP